jgi:hypothetical protein
MVFEKLSRSLETTREAVLDVCRRLVMMFD